MVIVITWSSNGEKSIECEFDGKRNGKYQTWYEDGQKRVECEYVDNIKKRKHRNVVKED